jgi:hypothetical protein
MVSSPCGRKAGGVANDARLTSGATRKRDGLPTLGITAQPVMADLASMYCLSTKTRLNRLARRTC